VTCIAGLVHAGVAWIGGDSRVSIGPIGIQDAQPKVWRQDGFVFAECGDVRATQVLRHCARFEPPPARGLVKYMVSTFAETVRKTLSERGVDRDGREAPDFALLVAARGELFYVGEDCAVCHLADGLFACGSGGSVALGSLATSYGSPRRRLTTALEVSERYCEGVRRPWTILNTRPK
jgi:ATP-dependent protease HslVU (ClpYQ) peptidase subunit